MCKGNTESNDNYLMRCDSHAQNLDLAGSTHIFCSPTILGKLINEVSNKENKEMMKRFKAMCFILRLDDSWYSELLEDLKKCFRGRDEYPQSISAAYKLLICTCYQIGYVNRKSPWPCYRENGKENFNFTQQGGNSAQNNYQELILGRDGVLHESTTCLVIFQTSVLLVKEPNLHKSELF